MKKFGLIKLQSVAKPAPNPQKGGVGFGFGLGFGFELWPLAISH